MTEDSRWCSGYVLCEKCGHEHMSVWPETVERQECPACGHMTQSPPTEDQPMTNSPEPWKIHDDTDILDAEDCMVLGGDCSDYRAPDFEDLDRIVACVNACQGIPTEKLPLFAATYKRSLELGELLEKSAEAVSNKSLGDMLIRWSKKIQEAKESKDRTFPPCQPDSAE